MRPTKRDIAKRDEEILQLRFEANQLRAAAASSLKAQDDAQRALDDMRRHTEGLKHDYEQEVLSSRKLRARIESIKAVVEYFMRKSGEKEASPLALVTVAAHEFGRISAACRIGAGEL